MLPPARGLSLSFRAGLRPPGWLLASRYPLIPRFPSALNASRQFASTRPQNANYVRFKVDPEQPLNYRRWSTGTQVFGGIVVLSVVYYVSQYVFPKVPYVRLPFLHLRSLETVPETGRWRFMDVSPKFETKVRLDCEHHPRH